MFRSLRASWWCKTACVWKASHRKGFWCGRCMMWRWSRYSTTARKPMVQTAKATRSHMRIFKLRSRMFVAGLAVGSRGSSGRWVELRNVGQVRPQGGWELGPQPDPMREVDDPVSLKGRGEETVVLNDHSLHRVLGRHEQGARAGDIHRGDVVEPALGSTEAAPALVQPSRRFGLHRRRTPSDELGRWRAGRQLRHTRRGLLMMVFDSADARQAVSGPPLPGRP